MGKLPSLKRTRAYGVSFSSLDLSWRTFSGRKRTSDASRGSAGFDRLAILLSGHRGIRSLVSVAPHARGRGGLLDDGGRRDQLPILRAFASQPSSRPIEGLVFPTHAGVP